MLLSLESSSLNGFSRPKTKTNTNPNTTNTDMNLLFFEYDKAATEVLEGLKAIPTVFAGIVYDSEGGFLHFIEKAAS